MTTLHLSPAGAARRAVTIRTLLVCGAIAGPLFVAAFLLVSMERPAPFRR
jgi:hypothetical protein